MKQKNKKRMLKLLFLFTLLYVIVPFTAEAAEDEAEQSRSVRVGWYNSEHFQEGDADLGRKSGYSYEYLQDIANYTGWEYEYVSGGWSELYDALIDGEIDLLAGVSYTSERESLMDFPAYEMGLESYYIYKKAGDEEINGIDIASLNGKRVGTLKNNLMTDFFESWMEESGVNCEEILFNDFQSRDEAFANGTIDAIIAVNNNVASNSGITPVVMVGESSYYLVVTKGRGDLLDELNNALATLKETNPFFIQSLQIKYFNHTAVNATLSHEENEWIDSHSLIRVGYIDGYLPYCSLGTDKAACGIITDIFREWKKQLGLSEEVGIEYKAYLNYTDMLEALMSGEIDAAFPIYDSIWNSEAQDIVQTNSLVEFGVCMVYRGEYNDTSTTRRIAVSRQSTFQSDFVAENYPECEVYLVDTSEDCLEAVRQGEATCTFLDSGQAETLLSERKYQSLKRLTLDGSMNYCIGVKKGNNVLYSLLNRGISLIDKSDISNAMYACIGSNIKYTLLDFLLDHIVLVLLVTLIIFGLIVAVRYKHYQAHTDRLTGLKNKRAYLNAVGQMNDRIKENKAVFAVIVFDLNGLKTINDTIGHEYGDMALTDMGKILKKVFGKDNIYRFGGDEFIILGMGYTQEDISRHFDMLVSTLEEINSTERPYKVPLSIAKGAAVYIPGSDTDYGQVFERADQAMYEDKKAYYEKHGDRRRQ